MARIPHWMVGFRHQMSTTRDRKKRQTEHAWWTALDRPTMEDLQKMHDDEEADTKWKTKLYFPNDW